MPLTGRQRLQHHAGAAAGVEPQAVEHGVVAQRPLRRPAALEVEQGGDRHAAAAPGGRRSRPSLRAVRRRRRDGSAVWLREAGARRGHHLLVGERLLEVVEGAHLDRPHGGRRRAVAGDHDDRGARIDLAQGLQRLEAVAVGQPDVEEDDLGPAGGVELERLLAARGGRDLEAVVGEDAAESARESRLRRRR